MKREAAYRVLIFDDDESIRQMLWYLFDSRGYEVLTFPLGWVWIGLGALCALAAILDIAFLKAVFHLFLEAAN